MKKQLILILIIIGVALSCRKDQPVNQQVITQVPQQTLSLAAVRSWYDQKGGSLSTLHPNTTAKAFSIHSLSIAWDKMVPVYRDKGNYWLVALPGQPSYDGVGLGYRKILFLRDASGQIRASIIEMLPDVLYYQRNRQVRSADFTGKVFVYDETYHLTGGFVYSDGKVIGNIRASNAGINETSALRTNRVQIIETCAWVSDNYINGDGEVVVYSVNVCNHEIIADDIYGGGSGDILGSGGGGGSAATGAGGSAPAPSNLPGEDKPGTDPKKLMNCFDGVADAGATMRITVYVQQPFPGTTFNLGPNSVGHTAIGLTKSNGSNSVTQIVGFYPNASGLDKIHAPSKIVDNGGDLQYNVSAVYTVNGNDFRSIVNYIANPPSTYDLTEFNCTDFVISACHVGGVTLPDATNTVGVSGPGGAMVANTPAGLGNSLENSSAANVNKNGGTTPNTKGPCN